MTTPTNKPFSLENIAATVDFAKTGITTAMVQHAALNGKWQEAMDNAESYPPIPNAELFWHHYGYEKPTSVEKWQWSDTFGKWSALVTFTDGWHGWTYPKRSES